MLVRFERNGRRAALVGITACLTVALVTSSVAGQDKLIKGGKGREGRLGLLINTPKAFRGYSLIAPLQSYNTYLIDIDGKVVHTWESNCIPGQSAYLLDNGHLLRAGHTSKQTFGMAPGRGGRVQEYTWDGELVWDYTLATETQFRHHDICKLPNNNVLMIVWEKKDAKQAASIGCKPAVPFLIDCVLEVQPTGKTNGKVVWEWHAWDHLVQEHDKSLPNFGQVAEHPERININFDVREGMISSMMKKKEDLKKLQSLGYVGNFPTSKKGKQMIIDSMHTNSVAYNAELDQIMLSVHEYGEVWVIDHSTTTAEAAGHKGGRYGKGGDLLYRWGNPQTYGTGKTKDQQLFFQHDAIWIPHGLPGEGHVLVFNNGNRRPDGNYSSVDEFVLPCDKKGQFAIKSGSPFGPDSPVWTYTAPRKKEFHSMMMGGAQRLPNGNTLICSTTEATVFEVTPAKEIVWKYVAPASQSSGKTVDITPEQIKKLEVLEQKVAAKVDKVLTAEQKEPWKKLREDYKDLPLVGHIMMPFLQVQVKLTAEQKAELLNYKKGVVVGELATIITPEQKAQYQKILHHTFNLAKAGKAAKGGGRMDSSQGGSFRAYRYAPNYPGLAGRDLTPGPSLEAVQAKEVKSR
jgi:hypothetical protein